VIADNDIDNDIDADRSDSTDGEASADGEALVGLDGVWLYAAFAGIALLLCCACAVWLKLFCGRAKNELDTEPQTSPQIVPAVSHEAEGGLAEKYFARSDSAVEKNSKFSDSDSEIYEEDAAVRVTVTEGGGVADEDEDEDGDDVMELNGNREAKFEVAATHRDSFSRRLGDNAFAQELVMDDIVDAISTQSR